jgi:thiol-disulfide isomerase/thioredoxin
MPRNLVFGLLALAALAACKRESPAAAAPVASAPVAAPQAAPKATSTNARFPSLQVQTLDGKPFDLAAQRGTWTIVNFWATWCGPCLKEMPELSALDAMREHVEVIGLAYDDIEPAALKAFLQTHPVVYPIALVDTYKPPADFATPRGLPTTYLIAPDGKVAKHFIGPITAKEIDAAIAAAGGPQAGQA